MWKTLTALGMVRVGGGAGTALEGDAMLVPHVGMPIMGTDGVHRPQAETGNPQSHSTVTGMVRGMGRHQELEQITAGLYPTARQQLHRHR